MPISEAVTPLSVHWASSRDQFSYVVGVQSELLITNRSQLPPTRRLSTHECSSREHTNGLRAVHVCPRKNTRSWPIRTPRPPPHADFNDWAFVTPNAISTHLCATPKHALVMQHPDAKQFIIECISVSLIRMWPTWFPIVMQDKPWTSSSVSSPKIRKTIQE